MIVVDCLDARGQPDLKEACVKWYGLDVLTVHVAHVGKMLSAVRIATCVLAESVEYSRFPFWVRGSGFKHQGTSDETQGHVQGNFEGKFVSAQGVPTGGQGVPVGVDGAELAFSLIAGP